MLEIVVEKLAADPGEIHSGKDYAVTHSHDALHGHVWMLRLEAVVPGSETATVGASIALDGSGRATAVPAVRWRGETWGIASQSKLRLLERLTAAASEFHRGVREPKCGDSL